MYCTNPLPPSSQQIPILEDPERSFSHSFVFLLIFFFFTVLGLELRTYTLSHLRALFLIGIFEIRSLKVFAQAGFKL
jgi:membrane-bound metal-dependent hydrolase YbcI (DUF457 family)